MGVDPFSLVVLSILKWIERGNSGIMKMLCENVPQIISKVGRNLQIYTQYILSFYLSTKKVYENSEHDLIRNFSDFFVYVIYSVLKFRT